MGKTNFDPNSSINKAHPKPFDFGFSAVNEEELWAADPKRKSVEEQLRGDIAHTKKTAEFYKDRLEAVEKMIRPFLNNLKANPEKDYIHWPNRAQKIDAFIAALELEFNTTLD